MVLRVLGFRCPQGREKKMSKQYVWLPVAGVLLLSTGAFAINDQNQNGNLLNPTSLTPQAVDCNNFCGNIVNDLTQTPASLDGSGTWSTTDDQWCANHGAQTSPSVPPATKLPQPVKPAVPCNIPVLQGDQNCGSVNRYITHCKVKGSQLETQCLAYSQSKQSGNGEKIVLALDTTAAAGCATACAATFMGGFGGVALQKVCSYAGMAASGGELIQSLVGSQGTLGKAMGAVGAGVALAGAVSYSKFKPTDPVPGTPGVAAVAGTPATAAIAAKPAQYTFTTPGGQTSVWTQGQNLQGQTIWTSPGKAPIVSDQLYEDPGNVGQFTPGTPGVAATKGTPGTPGTEGTKGKPADNGRKQACFAAASFSALAGIRGYSIAHQGDSQQQACDAVKSLVNQSLAPGFTPAALTTTSNTTGSTGTTAISTNTTVKTSNALLGNATACLSAAGSGDTDCMNAALNAAGASSNSAAATDAGILKTSGLAKALAAQAASLPIDQMVKHLQNGGSADALIQTALRGQGGQVGADVANIAKLAQQEAPNLGISTLSTTMTAGGAPAGAREGQENPFKLGGQGEGALGGARDLSYEKGPALNGAEVGSDGDIYHSTFQGSIFEIVSHTIKKTADRVDQVGYASPMNRSLAGH
jgi:hypothetical protein